MSFKRLIIIFPFRYLAEWNLEWKSNQQISRSNDLLSTLNDLLYTVYSTYQIRIEIETKSRLNDLLYC